jgi:hypothetical protein
MRMKRRRLGGTMKGWVLRGMVWKRVRRRVVMRMLRGVIILWWKGLMRRCVAPFMMVVVNCRKF